VHPGRITEEQIGEFVDRYDSQSREQYIDDVVAVVRGLEVSRKDLESIQDYEHNAMQVAEMFLPLIRDSRPKEGDAGWEEDDMRVYLDETTPDFDFDVSNNKTFIFRALYMAQSRVDMEEVNDARRELTRKRRKKIPPLMVMIVSPFYEEAASIEGEYVVESKIDQLLWLFKGLEYVDWFLIFKDDGSSDGSFDLVERRVRSHRTDETVDKILVDDLGRVSRRNAHLQWETAGDPGMLGIIQDPATQSIKAGAELDGLKNAAARCLSKGIKDAVFIGMDLDTSYTAARVGRAVWLIYIKGHDAAIGSKNLPESFGIQAFPDTDHNRRQEDMYTGHAAYLVGLPGARTLQGGFNGWRYDKRFMLNVTQVGASNFVYNTVLLFLLQEKGGDIVEFPVTVLMAGRPTTVDSSEIPGKKRGDAYLLMSFRLVWEFLVRHCRGRSYFPRDHWDKCREFLKDMAKGVYGVEYPIKLPQERIRRAVILAAGDKTDRTGTPYCLRKVLGRECILWPLGTLGSFFDKHPIVVVNSKIGRL